MSTACDAPLTTDDAAIGFAAAGSVPRLEVLLLLVRAGGEGRTTGAIGERLDMAPSTLAHHLRHLSEAGLIRQEKTGRSVVNKAVYGRVEALAGYLMRECCADSDVFSRASA